MPKSKHVLKMKKNMSNIDINVICRELSEVLADGFIDNIYEINDTLLKIKFRTKTGKKNLILDASKRINLTQYDYPIPQFPSQYCQALRKYLKGRRILKVYQYETDRIVVFDIANKYGAPWKFIVELFLGGNFLVIDDEMTIFMAKNYKVMKDRKILAKKEYKFPEQRGRSFLNLSKDELLKILKESNTDLVRTIARKAGLVGYLAEEVCFKAGVDKNMACENLSDNQMEKVFTAIKRLADKISKDKTRGFLYFDEEGDYLAFEPIDLQLYKDMDKKEYETFNACVDDYFAKIDSQLLLRKELKAASKIVQKYERIRDSQAQAIENKLKKRDKHQKMGNLLYESMIEIENLLRAVRDARKKGISFKEIDKKLKDGKEQGIPEAEIYERIYPNEIKISVNVKGTSIKLDFRKDVNANASHYYELAKKDKRKAEGARKALKKTEKILKKKKFKQEIKEQQTVALVKKPKAKWYEKFRWFESSNGFIIVGGRDASSNEAVVKKYMEKNDYYFHTEIKGAPSVILKNPEDKDIPKTTMGEAACFAASYSNAWREGWGSANIFWVEPDQVTKSPNPGEFLSKGAFFIQGEKNFVERPSLELKFGLDLTPVGKLEGVQPDSQDGEDDGDKYVYYPKIIAGPPSAIDSKTDISVELRPDKSGISGGDLAESIKYNLVQKSPEKRKKWARQIDINEIIHFLPPGESQILKE